MDGGQSGRVRLRQAVLVARELEPLAAQLREALGLGEPFRDPGVGEFGLHNVVFALGDCFIEIVSPLPAASSQQADTAAGRYLQRHGDGGYMAIFDVEDLEGARLRARELGVRVVWQIDLPDISGTHLHPADMRGAIVSIDRSSPYGSWRWGGPQWTGRIPADAGAPGRLAAIAVAVAEPAAVAARWGQVLGAAVQDDGQGPALRLDGGEVRFERALGEREGLVEIDVQAPHELPGGDEVLELGALRLRRLAGACSGQERAGAR
jgi:hypothetical protein